MKNQKIDDTLKLLVSENTLKKSWKHLIEKLSNQVKIKKENQKILKEISRNLTKTLRTSFKDY